MADITLILIGIGVLLLMILLTLFGVLVYSGLFHRVDVGAGPPHVQNLIVAYKFARGPYKNSGHIFTELSNIAPDNRYIGVYYDDPYQNRPENLRYIVGLILAEGEQEVDNTLRDMLMGRGYKVTQFPKATNVVRTYFPYTTMLSIFIAVSRVYPILSRYIAENRLSAHPVLEVYEGDKIHFMAPLARQNDFYVPETLDLREEVEDASSDEEEEEPPELSQPPFEVQPPVANPTVEEKAPQLPKDTPVTQPPAVHEEPTIDVPKVVPPPPQIASDQDWVPVIGTPSVHPKTMDTPPEPPVVAPQGASAPEEPIVSEPKTEQGPGEERRSQSKENVDPVVVPEASMEKTAASQPIVVITAAADTPPLVEVSENKGEGDGGAKTPDSFPTPDISPVSEQPDAQLSDNGSSTSTGSFEKVDAEMVETP